VKPDPRALVHAVRELNSKAAFYVGDTADDLNLVLRYRQEAQRDDPSLPPVLAVACAKDEEVASLFQARGADIVLAHVEELPTALEALSAAELTRD